MKTIDSLKRKYHKTIHFKSTISNKYKNSRIFNVEYLGAYFGYFPTIKLYCCRGYIVFVTYWQFICP